MTRFFGYLAIENKFFLVIMCFAVSVIHSVSATGKVPAVFIFGDSTADVGTNNFLPESKARADFPYYGIDFPHSRPTGRFSNGFNSADFLAKKLGFKRSPLPYLALVNNTKFFKRDSFRGANFASAGSGILDITGQTPLTLMKFGKESIAPDGLHGGNKKNVIPLSEQIKQFMSVYDKLVSIKGLTETKTFLSKSIFVISVGSNDIFVYFNSSRSTIPAKQFLNTLGVAYEGHIKSLLKVGAKKIGIISIPPIGCCPAQRVYNATGGCLEGLNELALAFHSTIEVTMSKLGSEYSDIKYAVGNAYAMTINVIQNPLMFGFKEVQSACCGAKRFNGEGICDLNANLCLNRHEYLFWDLFHPTMAASDLAAYTLYYGEPVFVSPINFRQLVEA